MSPRKVTSMVHRSVSFTTIINNLQRPDKAALNSAFLFSAAKYPKNASNQDACSFDRALRAAELASRLGVDTQTVVAILLMYLQIDGAVTFRHIQNLFGGEVALMVRNFRAVRELPYGASSDPEQIALMQHMVLSETQDSRVLIMQMVDVLVTLQEKTLQKSALNNEAVTALNIFVPIAHKLQLGTLKKELEDAAFSVLHPEEYARLKSYVDKKLREAAITIQEIQAILKNDLETSGIRITIMQGRIKSLYRLWEKLETHEQKLSSIHDIIAARIIVPDGAACYKAQKIIRRHFTETRTAKDYIKNPKENGYKSLHVFIQVNAKAEIELQIRSNKMHFEAEYGHPAHWLYASQNQSATKANEEKNLVDVLLKSHRGDHRLHLFPDSIFVQLNNAGILQLPKNTTVFDFVTKRTTSKENKPAMLKINGKPVENVSRLYNGAKIEFA